MKRLMPRYYLIVFFACLVLVGCGRNDPLPAATPTSPVIVDDSPVVVDNTPMATAAATEVVDTPTPVAAESTPTQPAATPVSTNTPLPTETPTPEPTAALVTTTLDSGWIRYELPGEGFAMTLPPRWRPVDLTPETLAATLQTIQDENPGIRGLISDQMLRGQILSGLTFYAIHAAPETYIYDTPTNLNVVKLVLQIDITLETYVQQKLRQIELQVIRNTPIRHERVMLGNVEAEKFAYDREITGTTGEFISVHIIQYLILDGRTSYVITLTAPRPLTDTYVPMFEEIGASFELVR
jgi:hypothetical protein